MPSARSRRGACVTSASPTQVEVFNEETAQRTHGTWSMVAGDRPGLLARVGLYLRAAAGSGVHNAKIATLGERIDDVFFITDEHDRPITDPGRIETLRRAICERIDEEIGA
ncbi:MAG: hypothetical protein U5R48_12975 [Gammaproteobacteria bacterium]|nr:hypothetical protein [Gammaproteobacteria bacterium]